MNYFVPEGSIVRKIWGKSDTILFIFAGAAAEFALNKAVDWLYFTGRLPADPIGRLFSTVRYARQIVFSETEAARQAIQRITSIHSTVEKNRGAHIPDWAYRDVLFMLIHYSMAAYELLERALTIPEKAEVFDVFYRVGEGMGIRGLPQNLPDWMIMREHHLQTNLERSALTDDLFLQYRKHLGSTRYHILWEAQMLVVPRKVKELLGMNRFSFLQPAVPLYKVSRLLGLDRTIKNILLPDAYKDQIRELDVVA